MPEHTWHWITGRMQKLCEKGHWHEVEKGHDFEICPSCGETRGDKAFKCDEIDIMIRATHPYGYRQGRWAKIIEIEWENNRPCFKVRFNDGKIDFWPIYDPADPYEFRAI